MTILTIFSMVFARDSLKAFTAAAFSPIRLRAMPKNTAKTTMWIILPFAKDSTIFVGIKSRITLANEVLTFS